jgi:hypothetical protein
MIVWPIFDAALRKISEANLVLHFLATCFVHQLLGRSPGRTLCSILWRTFLCRDRLSKFVVEHCSRDLCINIVHRLLTTFSVQQLLARSPGRILCSILWRTFLCSDRLAKSVVQHCSPDLCRILVQHLLVTLVQKLLARSPAESHAAACGEPSCAAIVLPNLLAALLAISLEQSLCNASWLHNQ